MRFDFLARVRWLDDFLEWHPLSSAYTRKVIRVGHAVPHCRSRLALPFLSPELPRQNIVGPIRCHRERGRCGLDKMFLALPNDENLPAENQSEPFLRRHNFARA